MSDLLPEMPQIPRLCPDSGLWAVGTARGPWGGGGEAIRAEGEEHPPAEGGLV